MLAPIALFVYNRLHHTKKVIEALKKNTLAPATSLIIFSDGPKNNEDSLKKVAELREYIYTISGFKSVEIIKRLENMGLARSIISGVTGVIEKYGQVIVVEDDLITSPHFLKYMNDGLEIYKNDNKVISIHGYVYPVKEQLPETFFLKGADCWGWATWKRGWDLFEADGQKLLRELEVKKLIKEFDFDNSYPYTKMLRDQIRGNNNSWAIRWYASAFLKNKLTLYPGKSLIANIGFDGSGTHCGSEEGSNQAVQIENISVDVSRIEIKEDVKARTIITKYFRKNYSLLPKILRYLKNPRNLLKTIKQKLNN